MPGLRDLFIPQLRVREIRGSQGRPTGCLSHIVKRKITMKELISLFLALVMVLALTACGEGNKDVELTVFAAASMQETLTEISGNYHKDHPDVAIVCNFDSSGTLQTQIEEGAVCDFFISAGQKQMDALADGG